MGLDRSRKKPRISLSNFQTLISSISSTQGLKPDLMEGLYVLLLNLGCSNPESDLKAQFNWNEFRIKFKDILKLSDALFDKLDSKFNELFSALNDASAHRVCPQSIFHVNVKAAIKELTLLLRCCIAVFKLLVLKQNFIVEKGRILLGILRRCMSAELKGGNEKSSRSFQDEVLRESMYVDEDGTTLFSEQLVTSLSFSEPSNPFWPLFCAVLEVFADELLMHESVRQYLVLVHSLSCKDEFLLSRHFGAGDIGSVLEVISAHFILSVSDDEAFKNFLSRLSWLPDNNFRPPELSLTTALSLLLNPIMFSAPKMFQAYVIILVSEVIGISMSFEHIAPSCKLRLYLSAFERTVYLYTRHMSNVHMKGYVIVDHSFGNHLLTNSSQIDFESCLLPATKDKIHKVIANCENLWNSHLSNTLPKKCSDLLPDSVSYTKESLHILEESFRDEILSILSCIILRGSSDDIDEVLHKKQDSSPQDICLLASILKLMSGSMLQAIKTLKQGRNSGSLKTLENVAVSKEYDFMVASFNCFQQFTVKLPVQRFLHDMMEIQPTKHTKSKWMLFHFSGLFSLSYASGLDFLVKNCIFTLMVLLNLFVFEEGDLLALESLLGMGGVVSSSLKSCTEVGKSECCSKAREVLMAEKSSRAVAQKFQKIRTLYLGSGSKTSLIKRDAKQKPVGLKNGGIVNHVESALSIEENTGESCNGEIFLSCVLEGCRSKSDINDLADFIECVPGKDYSDWLKGRQKFRKWKFERMAKIQWKKKRKALQKRA